MLESLDMRRDVQEIFKMTPHDKQVMMFSATLSKEIRPGCKKFMQDLGRFQLFIKKWTLLAEKIKEAGGTSQLVQHQSDHSPNLPHFLTRSFSEINSSFTLHNWHQFANSSQASDYPLEGSGNKKELTSQSAAYNCANLQNEFQISNEGTMEPSPKGKKRRRVSENHSEFAGLKNMNTAQENDECTGEQNDEKQKPEQKPVANVLEGNEVKLTNSHSLAERVRRERISERMKFLQELVPGCSKITGKAVMLDEIINYVLSLQWQVKFLSMKLSHVYPEMNVDIERMLSRNVSYNVVIYKFQIKSTQLNFRSVF
ncbi:hypothetical protein F0562_006243 [Nyssa sinensis]|uniref:BHLH domain-containing protein n=1 Tax=Nyssa sinensis TaxID=561372 RepID=A0A5J5AMK2_9ASTE|nr:hypothetical protein F0562_006243 [Nyssa sinensis]